MNRKSVSSINIALAALLIVVALLAFSGYGSGAMPNALLTPTPPAAASGQLAFMSDREGNAEIYIMNADGSNPVRLTNNDAWDTEPAWSPDGSRIAFTSDRDGHYEIYIMDADGSNLDRLTNNDVPDLWFAWSPDGEHIAFVSLRDDNHEILVMDADGANPVRLTNNNVGDYFPAWSPDGSRIVFTSYRDGNGEIYVMNTDGSGLVRLTDNSANDDTPAWSPDGERIIFRSFRDDNAEIYVMDIDGSNPINLTDNSANDFDPVWSPDGAHIAFHSQRDGNWEIYVMDADGSNPVRLTDNNASDFVTDWRFAISEAANTSTLSPLGFSAENPATSNDQWTPVVEEFDGVEMILVPAGCFMMGSEDGEEGEEPVHEQCFDAPFWIGRYEVTNDQYRPSGNWVGDDKPYENVTWYEARDFCASRDARLPTEAEWEYAARGPAGLLYPWGNEFVADNVVYGSNISSRTADVGSRPGGMSWVGAYDMSGNVWEWTSTIYRDYPYDADDGREDHSDSSRRVLRGGSWLTTNLDHFRAAHRMYGYPDSMYNTFFGFRCARDY